MMKMLRGLAIAICLAGATACAPFLTGLAAMAGGGGGQPAAVAHSGPSATSGPAAATVLDEKLLYAAEAAYNVPAHAYVAADSKGQLPASLKAKLKPLLVLAYERLQDARRLYALGNAADFSAAAYAAIGLANSAKGLLPASSLAEPAH